MQCPNPGNIQPKGNTMSNLDEFLAGYAQAMLWANAYDAETGELDENATYAYISPGRWWESVPDLDLSDARDFYAENLDDLTSLTVSHRATWSQHGHDFALTRNHHGAGFWDRGYGDLGDSLTDAAHVYDEAIVYTNAEG